MLFEQLGEEYPDTLGSIIAAEGAIANVVGMTQMNPPVKDLCESLSVCGGNVITELFHLSAPNDPNLEESTRESAGSHDQLDRSHRFVRYT